MRLKRLTTDQVALCIRSGNEMIERGYDPKLVWRALLICESTDVFEAFEAWWDVVGCAEEAAVVKRLFSVVNNRAVRRQLVAV